MYQYEETMAEYYDITSTGLAGDLEFYVEEAVSAGSPVLELGCGTGRILIPIARAGVEIVGLDATPAMLNVARRKIAEEDPAVQERIELVAGDMAEFDLERQFPLIIIPYRAFQHLLTPEDQKRALACIRRRLTDRGKLVFNVFDVRIQCVAEHMTYLEGTLKKLREFRRPDTGQRVVEWDTRRYDLERQIVEQDLIFEELDDAACSIARKHTRLELRWGYRHEMEYLLQLCGYEIEALYGDFRRGPYRPGIEQIWIARNGGGKP